MRIAVIGSGISGLAAAHGLRKHAKLTLFEANDYFGGHTNTIDVKAQGHEFGVDTGFLVYNERTYPKLIALLDELGVATAKSDMSFSVKLPHTGLEWSGSNLNTVFAQRRNLFRPRFYRMLREVLRFNRTAQSLAHNNSYSTAFTIGDFLQREKFTEDFKQWYFLPMIGCIWSCTTTQMLQFPLATLLRFCSNHGLLQVSNRPQWFTVTGGAREYVKRIIAGLPDVRLNSPVKRINRRTTDGMVEVSTAFGTERFDHVVLATHSDQALAVLSDPHALEQEVLGAISYQANEAVLHTDTAVLPRNQRAWAAWNYEHGGDAEGSRVCLHYLINKLQPLPCKQPIIVSLNPVSAIQPDKIIKRIAYTHPVFDSAAIQAQNELHRIQGTQNTWFCGAWAGYGFHEDGLKAGTAVAQALVEIIEGKRDSFSEQHMPLKSPSLPLSSSLASEAIHA